MSIDMSAYLDIFNAEATELLEGLNACLLALERNGLDELQINETFRIAHTIKGMAATMGFDKMAELTHGMEALLDKVRKKELSIDTNLLDLLFGCLDALNVLLKGEDPEVLDSLKAALDGMVTNPVKHKTYLVSVRLSAKCSMPRARSHAIEKSLKHLGDVVSSNIERFVEQPPPDALEEILTSSSDRAEIESVVLGISEVEAAIVTVVPDGTRLADEEMPEKVEPDVDQPRTQTAPVSETIRVNALHLDNLLNLVSEMVVNRTKLEAVVSSKRFETLTDALDELGLITSGLQQEILAMRMVPVSYVFNRFPRMVRDVAHQLSKEIDLVVEGQDIDLDRMVLDEISEPLTHLLRNAVDHGVESPEDRVAVGKSKRGTVKLSASRKHGSVVIEVSDDGRGVDPEKIKRVALEKGLVSEEECAVMEHEAVYALMAQPGFTTAGTATSISGRGVGLDAVKDKIDRLGGILRIRSQPGIGSSFSLEVPLTLALIPVLMVAIKEQTFALPLGNIVDILSFQDAEVHTISNRRVIVDRGETVSLVDHRAILGGMDIDNDPGYVVVIQVGDDKVGLKVNKVVKKQEIVVKPLSDFLRQVKGLAGSTVLGDGRVALVIDPRNLLESERKIRGGACQNTKA